ncbi:putative PTS IIA-like nitrogen-regulatory protein PtsN [Spirochaeta thermophila DSM 6578]|uniref:PTS IIA-like nitrogen-regulatory protein PtsN n=1 Tax=Winmispira thermophila (strain ATCC 700085 / DSM 6578 / Z-1203) TaxID=869211 RepID=G0GFU3_WINT7|nr:CBS domain-containing protein [Spirochaeta thermophila]AEJ61636.1 putative PTS IIA-like nitrogen-regulatory protein PtsN [Spirochaeta thermophila DSM 6578]
MKLSSYLHPEYIKLKARISSFEEGVRLLLGLIRGLVDQDEKTLFSRVQEREAQAPTVLDHGLCVPHLRLDDFDDHVIAVAVPERPFTYGGKEVDILILIISSKAQPSTYLNTLKGLATLFKDPDTREALLSAKHPEQFIRIIAAHDVEIKKGLLVRDIMNTSIVSISPDDTIKDVVDLFVKYHTSYLPVIEASGRFVGEIRMLDVLHIGLPQYTSMLGNLSFLSSFEPFEELLKNEERIQVKEVMKQPHPVCTPQTTVIELTFEMTRTLRRHVAVVEGEALVGVVSFMDILEKVLRV